MGDKVLCAVRAKQGYLWEGLNTSQNDGDILDYSNKDVLTSLQQIEDPSLVLGQLGLVDWSFTEDKTNILSHDIHPYPAKFIPQIPRNLIVRLSLRGELIWDPFGGSGTTSLEAILLGRRALSSDVNPLSETIGRAKTLTLTKEEEDCLEDFIEQLSILASDVNSIQELLSRVHSTIVEFIPPIPNIRKWFHPNAIVELAYLRWRIEQLPDSKTRTLARVNFSRSILKASYQDEETRYSCRPREVQSGAVIKLFTSNLASALKKVRMLSSLLRFRVAEFLTLDIRKKIIGDTPGSSIPPNSIDLIVSSPPYPNSNDYHLYHRFRLFWLGFDPVDFGKQEIGSHLRHQRETTAFDSYLNEMALALENMKQALRPGRYAVLVLGDAIFQGETYETADCVGRIAEEVGLEYIGRVSRAVHKTKRSFAAPARRANSEELLILRKPLREIDVDLISPPYTLWRYEDDLRKKEVKSILNRTLKVRRNGDLSVHVNPLLLDKLRRLTFTHGFVSSDYYRESTWQAVLENGDTFSPISRRKDPRYATHGLHEYKGKFYPQLAKSLFNIAKLEPEQLVLDPFCGSGTVLLECYLNGLKGVGFDMNPLAAKISRAKLDVLEVDPYLRDRLLARFQERLDRMESDIRWISYFHATLHEELLSWFPKPVIGKLGWLLNEVANVPDAKLRDFLEVVVSSIIREVSQQDPRDLRIRRRPKPIKDAPVLELIKRKLVDQRRRLQHFSERCDRSPFRFCKSNILLGDSRDSRTYELADLMQGSVDAIVTSPPYATALPYIDTDRLSILLLLGINSRSRSALEESITGSREIKKREKSEIEERIRMGDWGLVRSQKAQKLIAEVLRRNLNTESGFRKQNMAALLYRYFSDMSVVLNKLDRAMKPGSNAFFVMGDTRTEADGKVIRIESGKVLKETGEALGWSLKDAIPITVTGEDRPHNKNRISENEIIWFSK